MDRSVDIREGHEMAATSSLSDAVLVSIGQLLAVAANFIVARAARSRGDIDTLRRMVSLVGLVLLFAIRLAVRWCRRFLSTPPGNVARAQRVLSHPPQAWAAP